METFFFKSTLVKVHCISVNQMLEKGGLAIGACKEKEGRKPWMKGRKIWVGVKNTLKLNQQNHFPPYTFFL